MRRLGYEADGLFRGHLLCEHFENFQLSLVLALFKWNFKGGERLILLLDKNVDLAAFRGAIERTTGCGTV